MSSETFATAIFLITAVVAAAILVNAFFPVIYSATSTFTQSSQSADERLRTDIKIINAFSPTDGGATKIWIKNVGSNRIADTDIDTSDIYFGQPGDFDILLYTSGAPSAGEWTYSIREDTSNGYWDTGETLQLEMKPLATSPLPPSGGVVYFQYVLPTGIAVSTTYSAI
ncbi:flagellin [Methanomicrobiaceae archaeon CYW5]|uniref:flagellin n=1 Tax=Methanovulcanius yangii TaxID=1789227 RepID=UPI0029CA9FA5|nr:flagellin [Methanovulcanius yangii]MBT8507309.1 flagellin [Methanovulcanius yangii]